MDNVTEGLLSSAEVQRLASCTARQLDYLARLGIVQPTVKARGSGSVRRWSTEDACLVRAVSVLRSLGAPSWQCRRFVAALAETPELWSGPVVFTRNGRLAPAGIAAGRSGWTVDLAAVRAWVGAAPVEWPAAA